MRATEAFDADHFELMTAGDEALQAEIAELFRAQAALWQRLLIVDAPVDTWKDAAHTVKGSARGMGFGLLAQACEEAERAARTGLKDGPVIARTLAKVRARLAEAVAIADRLATPATEGRSLG